jgi:hypothetical protein
VPKYPAAALPPFDTRAQAGAVVPAPRLKRQEVQEQSIRDAEIPPDAYYPTSYNPDLMPDWPMDKP